MKKILILCACACIAAFPAQAQNNKSLLSPLAEKPLAPSAKREHSAYYLQQYKSCQKKKMPRTSWKDFLMATHPVITDQCCWDSVEMMEEAGARRVKDDECPPGTKRTRLDCPTSKSWCVK